MDPTAGTVSRMNPKDILRYPENSPAQQRGLDTLLQSRASF